jgi:transcription-repair coupling factor (superfamily II helicase)
VAPVRVDLPVTAYVPPEYIAYEASKIDAHRRIARAGSLRELGDAKAELTDRFGPPPEPVEHLISLQAIRLKAAALRATAVAYRGSRLQIEGLDLDDAWAGRLRAADERVVYFKQRRSLSAHRPDSDQSLLSWTEAVLDSVLDARAPTGESFAQGER